MDYCGSRKVLNLLEFIKLIVWTGSLEWTMEVARGAGIWMF